MNWLLARAQHSLNRIKLAECYRDRCVSQPLSGGRLTQGGSCYLNFASNDYLQLSEAPAVIAEGQRVLATHNAGGKSSNVVAGYSEYHYKLEEVLKCLTRRTGALLFPNAYIANLSLLTTLVEKGDMIFAERANHASLNQGMLLSGAKHKRFDMRYINQFDLSLDASQHKWLVSDHVFSVNGRIAPLDDYVRIATDSNTALIIDDVHGFGVMGDIGLSVFEKYHQTEMPLVTIGFGKALGVYGGAILGDSELIESMRQHARAYIYSTALPAYLPAMALISLQLIQDEPIRRLRLRELISYFKARAQTLDLAFDADDDTPIFSLTFTSAEEAVQAQNQLKCWGFFLTLMRYPTVKQGTACLRIALNLAHKEEMIDDLLAALKKVHRHASTS